MSMSASSSKKPDGWLIFLSPDQKMMAAKIEPGPTFHGGVPKPLFDTGMGMNLDTWFDVAPDGRFLIPTQLEQPTAVPLTVVLNWQASLKK